MAGDNESEFDVHYFVRTDSLRREGRVVRMLRLLADRGLRCRAVGVVKSQDGFEFPHYEYICRTDRIKPLYLKVALKFLEIQLFSLWFFMRRSRKTELFIIANHEFFLSGLLLSLFTRKRIYVDLHEHYFEILFRQHLVARFIFLQCFSGVIFANPMRARDFMGGRCTDPSVSILRNFPDTKSGSISTPQFTEEKKLVIGIVSGNTEERFGAATIRALDQFELSDLLRIETFGAKIDAHTTHVQLKQNGRYHHAEIMEHLKIVDVSMVFYDPDKSLNNLYCEPNRFFEAYNSGKIIYAFRHPSLIEFYDDSCRVIDKHDFSHSILTAVDSDIWLKANKTELLHSRKLLTYRENTIGINQMITGIEPNATSQL